MYVLRFYSSNDSEGLTSLQEYVERMKETQEHIYYVAGSSRQEVVLNFVLDGKMHY